MVLPLVPMPLHPLAIVTLEIIAMGPELLRGRVSPDLLLVVDGRAIVRTWYPARYVLHYFLLVFAVVH